MIYINHIKEQMQNKKHIVITGSMGSGKSTLLNELRRELDSKDGLPGLITWNEHRKAVYMRRVGDAKCVMIGEYNPQKSPAGKLMEPVTNGFNIYGVSLLESFIHDDSEWVTIDEIGFLEACCQPYLNKLFELFDQKRVIAVVRKQNLKHINDIVHRDDAFVIDLDVIQMDTFLNH